MKIPTKSELRQPYADLLKKQDEIRARQTAAKNELSQIRARIAAGNAKDGSKARAEALITGEEQAQDDSDRARMTALVQEISDCQLALEMLGEKIEVESRAASELVVDAIEDQYRSAVSNMCDTMIRLNEEHRRFASIVDPMNLDHVSWTGRLRPMQPDRFLGSHNSPYNWIALYLKEAAEYGFIKESQIPKGMREGA